MYPVYCGDINPAYSVFAGHANPAETQYLSVVSLSQGELSRVRYVCVLNAIYD